MGQGGGAPLAAILDAMTGKNDAEPVVVVQRSYDLLL